MLTKTTFLKKNYFFLGILICLSGALPARLLAAASIGIMGHTPPATGASFKLQGVVSESLTIPAEAVLNGNYQINLAFDGSSTPFGNFINPPQTLRYCSNSTLTAETHYGFTLLLGSADWMADTGYIYVAEARVEQPVLDSVVNADGSILPGVVRVGSLVSGAGSSTVVFDLIPSVSLPAGTCFVIGSGNYGSSSGNLTDMRGNPTLRIHQGASSVRVTGELYPSLSTATTRATVSRLETATNSFIEIRQQYEFNFSQTATATTDPGAFMAYSNLLEEGMANDVLSSNNDADLLAAAATYRLVNNAELIEDAIPAAAGDYVKLSLIPDITLDADVNWLAGGFIESDDSGPMQAGLSHLFNFELLSSGSYGLGVAIPLSDFTAGTHTDDMVISLSGDGQIPQHQWNAQIDFSVSALNGGEPFSIYQDTAASPAFRFVQGVAQAGYSSSPSIGSQINFGSVGLGQQSSIQNILVTETGNIGLLVKLTSAVISGANASDFKLLAATEDLDIPNGGSPQNIQLTCTPSAVGVRSATLTLATNDSTKSTVSYSLTCTGVMPGFASSPAAGEAIFVAYDTLGNPGSAALTISETGSSALRVTSAQIQGLHASEFSLASTTSLPIVIDNNAPAQQLSLTCQPSTGGIRMAQLILSTNDNTQATVTYPLICAQRLSTQSSPGFNSYPLPGSRLTTTFKQLNTASSIDLYLFNSGSADLLLSSAQITGADASYFQLKRSFPMTLSSGKLSTALGISCSSDAFVTRNAQLVLQTNDSSVPSVTYPLVCELDPGSAPSDIQLSTLIKLPENTALNTVLGQFSTIDADVGDIHTYSLLDDANGLFALQGANLVLAQNLDYETATSHQITVRSMDSRGLVLDKSFNIDVTNVIDTVISGELLTNSGVTSTNLSIDAPETVRVTGAIHPDSTHLGLQAEVFVRFDFVAQNAIQHQWIVSLGQQTLQPEMNFTLFNGAVLHLTGEFNVSLYYVLADTGQRVSQEIVHLTVSPNRLPEDIQLSNNVIAENSAPGTLIGTLTTTDPDRAEYFRYAITQEIGTFGPYFKIVGNELRLADNLPLDYETQSSFLITILSVDASGGSIEKQFTIEVSNEMESRLSGEVRNGNLVLRERPLTVGHYWPISVDGMISPDKELQERPLEVFTEVHYTAVGAEDVQVTRKVLAEETLLTNKQSYPLLQGPLKIGTYQVYLGYLVLDDANAEEVSSVVAEFTVETSEETGLISGANVLEPACEHFSQPQIYNFGSQTQFLNQSVDIVANLNGLAELIELGIKLEQDPVYGYLYADLATETGQVRNAWQVYGLSTELGKTPGIQSFERGALEVVIPPGFSILGQPAVQSPCALADTLGLPISMRNTGDLRIGQGQTWFSVRPSHLAAEILDDTSVGLYLNPHPNINALAAVDFVFVDVTSRALNENSLSADHILMQRFYPSPAYSNLLFNEESEVLLLENGSLRFHYGDLVYQGVFDVLVTGSIEEVNALKIEALEEDINGDGSSDYRLLYPSGEQQYFFAEPGL